jgi:hypothetical protein
MTAKEQAKAMSKTPTLIRPDKDSLTQFDPYYHLTEEEFNRILDTYAKQYMKRRLEAVNDNELATWILKITHIEVDWQAKGAQKLRDKLLKELKDES